MEDLGTLLFLTLGAAWLLPLVSFVCILLFGNWMGKAGVGGGYLATLAIVLSGVLSLCALFGLWLPNHALPSGHDDHAAESSHHDETGQHKQQQEAAPQSSQQPQQPSDQDPPADSSASSSEAEKQAGAGGVPISLAALKAGEEHPQQQSAFPPDEPHDEEGHGEKHGAHGHAKKPYYSGVWYALGTFGDLEINISYYIDSLTVAMFCMITLIASCIHFYSMGYMHEELHDMTDHEVTLESGEHLHRPGRYHRFFQYMSLFCFSMLGLVLAGNIAMVFVFWELVGICSYFLIGFYVERKSASNAANKAFIVNRVGDFGMIIGLMALWSSLGTFAFGDTYDAEGHLVERGIFRQVRPDELYGEPNHNALQTPRGMVLAGAGREVYELRQEHADNPQQAEEAVDSLVHDRRESGHGYWLLVIAGLGIFCGCVGKSAQFPLHVWLPDAMEGPTPVSALVHSATMVAAGVYLVGRFYPVFAPEVLLTIAYIGGITLFLAATIAVVATDIKRVLAYSTVSQLGYMMLALGVGGWVAGLFHLFTHAFFKSLLFLCSGSVIHAVHSNEMTEMGGLLKKMPYTAWTMLVGCLAIIGAGIPFVFGLSGYYSKDAILEQALLFSRGIGPPNHPVMVPGNPTHGILFMVAAGGAAITAFYMFRMWYMTFLGEPRNKHRYDHAHESPKVMYVPLIILAVFAAGVAWELPLTNLSLRSLIEQSQPAGTLPETAAGVAAYAQNGMLLHRLVIPNEHVSHQVAIRVPATLIAFGTALGGLLLATVLYAWRLLDPADIRNQFRGLYRFLRNKWWFDELYHATFFRFTHVLAKMAAWIDRNVLDRLVDSLAWMTRVFSRWWDTWADRRIVDGLVNLVGNRIWNAGVALHRAQTGQLRQYILFIVVATIVLYLLATFAWQYAMAG